MTMKYIEPPTKKQPKYLPKRKPPKDHLWIRLILGAGTILILYIISQYTR